MGEKRVREATGCILRLNLGKFQCFGLAFHSMVTLRVFDYAPPDTVGIKFAASCLRIFAVNRRCRPDLPVCTFSRGGFIVLHAPKAPLPGELAAEG